MASSRAVGLLSIRRFRAGVMICASSLACFMLSCAGRTTGENSAGDGRLEVFVSVLPQAFIVERIGGERVTVDVLVGPGQSPHTFEPTPRQVARLCEARAYFTIGMAFESALLPKIRSSVSQLHVVDMQAGVPLRAGSETCEHGNGEGEHAHGVGDEAADPHSWLNPRYARIQAATVAAALEQLDPAGAADFRRNFAALQRELDELDAELTRKLAPLKGRAFYVYHPAYGYFADAYGLRQIPVELEGKEPSAKQLAELMDRARAESVRVIFVQPQFSQKAAAAVAEGIGGVVVPLDDLSREYVRNLREMADKIDASARRKTRDRRTKNARPICAWRHPAVSHS